MLKLGLSLNRIRAFIYRHKKVKAVKDFSRRQFYLKIVECLGLAFGLDNLGARALNLEIEKKVLSPEYNFNLVLTALALIMFVFNLWDLYAWVNWRLKEARAEASNV